jgi:hypothetical protein
MMKPYSVVYTTDNSPPGKIVKICRNILEDAVKFDTQVVEIRQEASVRRSLLAMFANVLSGLQQCEHETVFIAEQDVLYPADYFDYGPGRHNVTYAVNSLFLLPDGFAARPSPAFSSCAGNRDFLIDAVYRKITEQCVRGKVLRSEIEPMVPRMSGQPTVDIRHGMNITGMRKAMSISTSDPYWGEAREWWSLMEAGDEWRRKMNRTDVINELIGAHGFKSYLEIGVRNAADNFNRVECEHKVGVDCSHPADGVLLMRSEEFFAQNDEQFDLLFLDGNHTYQASKADFLAAMEAKTESGLVVVHDCLPLSEQEARPERPANRNLSWCGEVWRVWSELADGYIVDCDHGLGVAHAILDDPRADVCVPPWKKRNAGIRVIISQRAFLRNMKRLHNA